MKAWLVAFPLAVFVILGAQQPPRQKGKQHQAAIKETDSELLWTGRYAHCDYGFQVMLPEGFLAHTSVPPSPGAGFLVGLPDTDRSGKVTFEDDRFIWVSASYNSIEWKSLEEAADETIGFSKQKPGFKVIARRATALHGKPAIRFRVQYDGPREAVIREEIISIRSGIVYEIGFRTTAANYEQDLSQFAKIAAGFRFWKIHYCT